MLRPSQPPAPLSAKMKPPPPRKSDRRRSSISTMIAVEIPSFNLRKSLDVAAASSASKPRMNQGDKTSIPEEPIETPVAGCKGDGVDQLQPKSLPNIKGRGGKSMIPTPISSRPMGSKTVVRPIPNTDLVRMRQPGVLVSQSQRKADVGSTFKRADSATSLRLVSSNRTSTWRNSSTNLTRPTTARTAATTKKGMTRASSMESFGWLSSTCVTPGNSRRLSGIGLSTVGKKTVFCAKSNEKLYRSLGNHTTVIQKILKPPSAGENKLINVVVFAICDLLEDKEYPKRFSVKEFQAMPASEFFNVCQFFLNSIRYRKLTVNKIDDVNNQLIEVAALLKYPGIISKSLFKNVKAHHAWPAAITFLIWLGCRITSICTPRSFGVKEKVRALSEDEHNFTELLLESYRRMFLKTESFQDADLLAEKEAYRNRIMEAYMFDPNHSAENLQEALAKLWGQFDNLESEPDPTEEVIANTAMCTAKKAELQKKQGELKNIILKYKNTEHFSSQQSTLDKKIAKEEELCNEVSLLIEQRPLNIQGLDQCHRDMEAIKKQQQSLELVIDTMKNRLKIRHCHSSNAGTIFYQLCEKFRIIDEFNEHLTSFEKMGVLGDMERATRNPFNQQEFDAWLIHLRRILKHTDRIFSTLERNLEIEWRHETNSKIMVAIEDIQLGEREVTVVEAEIEKLRITGLNVRSEMNAKIATKLEEQKQMMGSITELESDLKLKKADVRKLETLLKSETERNGYLGNQVEESHSLVVQTYLEGRAKKASMGSDHCMKVRQLRMERRAQLDAERAAVLKDVLNVYKLEANNRG